MSIGKPHISSRQRINIALARGVLLKPSGEMKWIANCRTQTARPQDSRDYGLFPIEADTEADAARQAAAAVAKAEFGDGAEAASVSTHQRPLYYAHIGRYQGKGLTRGCSVSILITRYRGAQ